MPDNEEKTGQSFSDKKGQNDNKEKTKKGFRDLNKDVSSGKRERMRGNISKEKAEKLAGAHAEEEKKKQADKRKVEEEFDIGQTDGEKEDVKAEGEEVVLTPNLQKRALDNKPLERVGNVNEAPDEIEEDVTDDESDSIEKEEKSNENIVVESMRRGGNVEEVNAEVVDVSDSTNESVNTVDQESIPVDTSVGDFDEFEEDFWDILAQAGISKRMLMWILIIFIAGLIFFFLWIFDFFGGSSDPVVDDDPVEVVNDNEPEAPVVIEEGAQDSISAAYILGSEFSFDEDLTVIPIGGFSGSGFVDAAYNLGTSYSPVESDLVEYMALLRRMQNLFETDVYDLADGSLDRAGAIDDYLEEMQAVIQEGEDTLEEIRNKLADLDNKFGAVVENRDIFEQSFFVSSQNLSGEEAYGFLQGFKENAQSAVGLKADYNAYATTGDMLVNSLNFLEPRYDDVFLNQDAIVEGIQVFDIPNSELGIIIRLGQ